MNNLYTAIICTSQSEYLELKAIERKPSYKCVWLNPLDFQRSKYATRGLMFEKLVLSPKLDSVPKGFKDRLRELQELVESRLI